MDRRSLLQASLSTAAGASIAGAATAAARPSALVRTPTIVETDDGAKLFVRQWGSGPPVLFLHAWALNSQAWRYQMVALADAGFRCVAFDRRGHGRSADSGGGYDMDSLADDVARVIAALDLKRLGLVGHSLGGGEAVRYLTRHSSKHVNRLVLIAPTTPYIGDPQHSDPAMFEQVRAAFRHDFPGIVGANIAPFVVPATPPWTVAWIMSMFGEVSLQAAIDCHRAFTTADFRAELPNVSVPTHVVHGDADASVPLAAGEATARLIPGATLSVVKGAPHGLLFTHVEQVNAELLRTLKARRSTVRPGTCLPP